MNDKWFYRISHFRVMLIVLLACITVACDTASVTQDYTDEQLDSLTLNSLVKINDYPLYMMNYYGDYGFGKFLETGNRLTATIELPVAITWSCTCFAAYANGGENMLGRNFDWYYECIPLLLFTNPSDGFASVSVVSLEYFGYNKNNLPDDPENRNSLLDAPWMPFDGMNEKGVAIGMMAVPHAESPYDPEKVTIGEIELIRLVLDYAENLEHAIDLIREYNIRMEQPPIHYLISDSEGSSAIIEFYEGEMIVIRSQKSWQVSTNFIFSEYVDSLNANCWRYNRACDTLESVKGEVSDKISMEILQSVSHGNTIWSVVYNMISGDIDITAGRNYSNILKCNLKTQKPMWENIAESLHSY